MTYSVASVELEVQGRVLTVEAAVSNQLPSSVLLGTDVPGLSELLQLKSVNTALMAMTRSQTKRSQANEARQHPEKIVEQLLLPKQYYQVICKLAHTISLAGHLGRDKTVKRITRHFTGLQFSVMWQITVKVVQSVKGPGKEDYTRCPLFHCQ